MYKCQESVLRVICFVNAYAIEKGLAVEGQKVWSYLAKLVALDSRGHFPGGKLLQQVHAGIKKLSWSTGNYSELG